MDKVIPVISTGTALLQSPQMKPTVDMITKAIPSAGSTILAPAGIVSRSVYDVLNATGQSYGQINSNINKNNPFIVSASPPITYVPQISTEGFVLNKNYENSLKNIYGNPLKNILSSYNINTSFQNNKPISSVSKNYSLLTVPSLNNILKNPSSLQTTLPSVGQYVFGSGNDIKSLKLSIPWLNARSRKQRYTKNKRTAKKPRTNTRKTQKTKHSRNGTRSRKARK